MAILSVITCLCDYLQQKDVLEILDLSYNSLTGTIPSDLGDFDDTIIHLKNNSFDM